jgi:DNA replication and repair protein RecF
MRLTHLQLTEFRSYRHLDLSTPAAGLILTGRNASGKSTLLEAIRMLSTLRSPRSTHDRDVIHWSSGEDLAVAPYARVVGNGSASAGDFALELGLQRADDGIGPLRKVIRINQQLRRMQDSIGTFQTVLFTPEDLDLVSGSPSGRRRFIDLLLSQIDRGYVGQLSRYLRVLEQRNSLLRSHQKSGGARTSLLEQLGFWDEQLIEHGAYLAAARREMLGRLCNAFADRVPLFTETASLSASYAPNLGIDFLAAARIDDDRAHLIAVARRELESQVRMRRDEEIRRGVTLVGPHRDDLELQIDGRPLGGFGSRGQQRLAVIALKLAEADVIASEGDFPILLLDDLLSELDQEHRATLLEAVRGCGAQIFLTTADSAQIENTSIGDLPRADVTGGSISIR